jgi:protein-S-isoprenylcysteine O-methyltransferase Ste14
MSILSIVSAVLLWGYGDPYFNNMPWTVAGLILIGLGLFYRIWSISTLGRQFTATVRFEQKHQLIETGPYKLVRHPSYLGAFVTIIGYPVFLHTPLGIGIAAVAMFIAYYFRIRAEEAALIRHFGDTYSQYQQRTYRIIPFIW